MSRLVLQNYCMIKSDYSIKYKKCNYTKGKIFALNVQENCALIEKHIFRCQTAENMV